MQNYNFIVCPGTDVMNFRTFSQKAFGENNWAFLTQNAAKLCENWITTLVLLRKTPFFKPKIGKKIAAYSDHNIDPSCHLGDTSSRISIQQGQDVMNCLE
jgi:hypothetical protein